MTARSVDPLQRARQRALATGVALTAPLALALLLPPYTFFAAPHTYAALHLLLELLAIVVSLPVFAVGWNPFADTRSGDQVVLACSADVLMARRKPAPRRAFHSLNWRVAVRSTQGAERTDQPDDSATRSRPTTHAGLAVAGLADPRGANRRSA